MGTKRLYSYMDRAKVHEKSWCPARSMQYSYPTFPNKERHGKNKVTRTIAEDSSKDNSGCSNDGSKNASDRCSSGSSNDMDSYSTASFESDPSDVASSDGESDTDSSEPVESVSRSSPSKTGRQKTIQVCCQTLQYWCTCDQ